MRVEQREGALLRRQLGGGEIGRIAQRRQPGIDQHHALRRAIARAAEDQRVGQARDAQPDAPLGLGLGLLPGQRKARHVDDVVQHPHGDFRQPYQLLDVEMRVVFERTLDEPGEIDRPKQARAIRGKGLLAAGITAADRLAITKIVLRIDAVDEDHAGLGSFVGRAHDAVPQIARPHAAIDLAVEFQIPMRIGIHRVHERVAHQHGEIEIGEPSRRALGVDEGLDVGMVDGQRRHHRAAPASRRHDGAAHRIPHIHERHRARGVGAHALHGGALGPQCREVVADAAALLQRQRRLAHGGEDAVHRIFDGAHHEAIEQRHGTVRAGPGQDAAGGQEAMPGQRLGESERLRTALGRRLCRRRGQGDARPGVGEIAVHRRAVRRFQPVLHVPDLAGNIAHGLVHRPAKRVTYLTLRVVKVKFCSLNVPDGFNDCGAPAGCAPPRPVRPLRSRWRPPTGAGIPGAAGPAGWGPGTPARWCRGS